MKLHDLLFDTATGDKALAALERHLGLAVIPVADLDRHLFRPTQNEDLHAEPVQILRFADPGAPAPA